MSYYIPENSGMSGVASGASMGAMFGPAGIAIGGALGGIFGGNASERRRAKRRATRATYSYAGEVFADAEQRRVDVQSYYDTELSMARARYSGAAGGGMELGGSWDTIKGNILAERNKELEAITADIKEFKKSDQYEWVKNDYEYMLGSDITKFGREGQRETRLRLEGRTGQKLFDSDTEGMVIRSALNDDNRLYKEYVERISPGFGEWEKQYWGSDEDRATYNTAMQERIERANQWYRTEVDMAEWRNATRKQRMQRGDFFGTEKGTGNPMNQGGKPNYRNFLGGNK